MPGCESDETSVTRTVQSQLPCDRSCHLTAVDPNLEHRTAAATAFASFIASKQRTAAAAAAAQAASGRTTTRPIPSTEHDDHVLLGNGSTAGGGGSTAGGGGGTSHGGGGTSHGGGGTSHGGGSSAALLAMQPEYMLPYLMMLLAKHPDFPQVGSSTRRRWDQNQKQESKRTGVSGVQGCRALLPVSDAAF